jgi:twitching motility protein PilJ
MIESRGESSTQPGSSFKNAVLIVLLVFSIILIGTIFVVLERQNRINNKYIQLTIEQQLLSRSVVTQAFEASRGIALAFDKLKETRDRFDAILNIQRGNDSHQQDSLPEPSSALVPYVRDLDGKWRQVRSRVDVILAGREAVLSVSNFVPLLEGLIPRLVELSDQLSTALANSSVSPKQVYMVTRQLLLGQRMESNLNRMLTGGTGAASAADDFERDVTRFGTVLRGMATGDPRIGIEAVSAPGASAKVSELTSLFSSIEKQAGLIRGNSPALFQVQSATQAITTQGDDLLEVSSQLLAQYRAVAKGGVKFFGLSIDEKYAYGIGFLALGLALWLARETNRDTKQRLLESEQRKQETEDQNRRNQDAILRLLDELGDLAEGDLTVQASVTEDITGAIADSVNYAIEALRDLVSTINNTSELVASAAQETRSVADRLARASEVQARQIESSSKTVMQMAQFMDEVSAKTASSSEVAEKSVNIAHEGGDRVRRTIQGMDAIREHIQETSKRIKRLGESSQEIGDIVALINDIADQTNILALNAAIQATSAGEAGRGFAVVADEVQRLAERASNATKRIEALVKTTQADTNEAIISMEKSTTEVVNGADLAEKAGEALEEIETVSARLAALIDDVSKAAAQVTEMASRVSTAMITINEITAQTSESSVATASSIGKLNQLAQELRQSVAGFRLPDQALSNA